MAEAESAPIFRLPSILMLGMIDDSEDTDDTDAERVTKAGRETIVLEEDESSDLVEEVRSADFPAPLRH